eukprot:TRINITY_DN17999_c0_g1_i2.p1 TRINITY_DN17999_c0_g1~~TRINITY_DN17999_c0_g1_i2.p1  ORF type:complete len:798 (-),score=158.09 TRINITY_DN17999_c0_g1_i2:39-2432(-)
MAADPLHASRVERLVRYFDVDGDGKLSHKEFRKLWASVTNGEEFTKAQFTAACKKAGCKSDRYLAAADLCQLYSSGLANFEGHFSAFLHTRHLPEDAQQRSELKAWTKNDLAPGRASRVRHLADGTCVVLTEGSEPGLYLLDGGELKRFSCPAPQWLSRTPAGTHAPANSEVAEMLILHEDNKFKTVKIESGAGGDKAAKRSKDKQKGGTHRLKIVKTLGGFPEDWGDMEDDDADWDACLCSEGKLHIAGLVAVEGAERSFELDDSDDDKDTQKGKKKQQEDSDEDEEEPPLVFPAAPKRFRLVAWHDSLSFDVCRVEHLADTILISNDGMWCSYKVMVGDITEEANRGEWYVCRLEKGAVPVKISQGPIGRVSEMPARFSPDGRRIVYQEIPAWKGLFHQANHCESHPITRHMDLWLVHLADGQPSEPVRLTKGSMQIDTFDWIACQADTLWLSTTSGPHLNSFILNSSTLELESVTPAAAYECLPSWNPQTGSCVYAVESVNDFEGLWDKHADRRTALPGAEMFDDVLAEVIQWTGPGDATVSGAVYFSNRYAGERPLLVWVHGGPTCAWPILRGNISNDARLGELNFTALVRAGYLLFVPLYRGTLGYGDSWSMATIGHHGSLDGDLGDILSGVKFLQQKQIHRCSPSKAGIFGESYGGYMTIKALSVKEAAGSFQCGAALYGYIDNRQTSLLTGDFTWEREFLQDPAFTWPPPERSEDSLRDLGNIQSSLLLLHGDEDDVCPVSHSQLVYQELRRRGIPTQLAIYPGQGHGFEGDKVQQDCLAPPRSTDAFTT